ncbi:MAG TPA: hypothetical protein VMT28_13515 [Terriglobales bacterium]|jgi:hypothetical protein|nr:hypothetical protein [Terriglobales bacterium]
MYPHSFLWHYLWVAPYAIQAIILAVMLRRRLWHEFPVFFAYTGFEIVQGGVLFALDHNGGVSPHQYWEVYWVAQVLSIALRFAVIYEIFAHIFRPYAALGELSRIVFRWASVLLILVALVVAAYAPGDATLPILSGVNVVGRAVGLVQSGLMVFLFLFSSYFGLSWRSFVYGIALGMGIFASVDLATSAIRVATGLGEGTYVLSFVTMAAYHCCVVIWLVYLLAPEVAAQTVKELPEHNLEEWNTALQRLLTR